ncbi:hypothetical protein EDI_116060 [Entamoeba dispar SAW760]|uniref:Uncharacterized protein n=1 Tax=Entamoeba dispar (strain ATCC PRA-260 / SAW760) TaxID=370354 RepID=B0EG69_ENTDS|nr:uncharacterized protein EDI_116060 [Entamoeba dispar SAW760]EDR26496.1 hypothetical protein EDI_116060 [Entamoeba dispar SAW760]|eukprot:EDR26496.1 hypothetical protein EDI_116060 [Entamoeba dispar SAW760]
MKLTFTVFTGFLFIDYRKLFVQPTFKNEAIDTSKFLYDGKCRDIFRYKPNNKRDLVFWAMYFKNQEMWVKQRETIVRTMSILKSGIPNVKKVLVLYGQAPDGFLDLMKSFNVKVIRRKKELKYNQVCNAAVYRFFDLLEYLKQHGGEFDRVAITDFRDVIWFADAFSTIRPDELVITNECSGKGNGTIKCIDYTQKLNYKWLTNTFGKNLANQLRKERKRIVNVGIVIGNIQKVKRYCELFKQYCPKDKIEKWGTDQALNNYLYYTHKLDELNVTIETISQRIGFDVMDGCIWDKRNKILIERNSLCSPVLRHKQTGASTYHLI